MLQINLPNFGNAIVVDKDRSFDDYKGYVLIRGGHAIVSSPMVTLLFDLRTYFQDVEDINDGEEEDFEKLLEWLEGKNFTKKFWKELSGNKIIEVVDDKTISITESEDFTKKMSYDHRTVLDGKLLEGIDMACRKPAESHTVVAFSFGIYEFLRKAAGKIIGNRNIITEFVERGKPVRFAVDDRNFMFGVMQPHGIIDEKNFNFDCYNQFCEDNPVV